MTATTERTPTEWWFTPSQYRRALAMGARFDLAHVHILPEQGAES